MDIRGIVKLIATIGVALSLFFIMPVIIGIIYHEEILPFILFDLLFLLVNLTPLLILRKHSFNLKIKESIVVVNLIWILLGIGGAVPFVIYHTCDFSSAVFEAISGFTTTGATVFSDIESLPKMLLFLRSLMHWLGGMGIIVLGVGLFSLINPTGSLSLFKAESTGISIEKLTPKIKDTAVSLWRIYLFFTLCDTALLYLLGMDWFDAINHAFSTISTGGFSTKNSSLGFFQNDAIIWVTTFFMVISGINFLAHLRSINRDFSGYKSEEIRWYIFIFLLLSTLLTIVHIVSSNDSFYFSATHSFFTIASVLTTTGYATLDYEQWGQIAVIIVFLSMLIGGNVGSTAGGVKVIRYVLFFKNIAAEIKRILHPNAIVAVFVNGNRIKSAVTGSAFGFFALYILTSVTVMLYLYARGLDEMSAISTALATVGNIGPGFALTGPSHNYGFFEWYDKLVLSSAMIIGRLECYTVFVLFARDFWKKF